MLNEMTMPGAGEMAMAWMRMPGQTWAGAAASFVAMWDVMMVAMMLPSLVPVLLLYHRRGPTRLGGRLTVLVGAGYLLVWTIVGVAVYPVAFALAAVHVARIAVGVVILLAGALQLTAWHARHVACWREALGDCHHSSVDAATAWRNGLRLGAHCVACSAGLTACLLVVGVMDLRAMAVVTVAMTVERLAPVRSASSRQSDVQSAARAEPCHGS